MISPIAIIAILISLSVHEWAHAFMADRLGDSTARIHGRLTLNPVAHLDLLGSILFLTVGFGWAKPVPVDPRNFRSPLRDNVFTALAGPLSNLILAFASYTAIAFFDRSITLTSILSSLFSSDSPSAMGTSTLFFFLFLRSMLAVNLVMLAFNLIPVPPLDGSHLLEFALVRRSPRAADAVRLYGPCVLLALVVLTWSSPYSPISLWIEWLSSGMLWIFRLLPW